MVVMMVAMVVVVVVMLTRLLGHFASGVGDVLDQIVTQLEHTLLRREGEGFE